MEKDKIIGQQLKKIRKQLGLTQEEMIGGVIHKSHYSKIERGLEGISADSLFRILFLHNIDIDQFFEEVRKNYRSSEDVNGEELENSMRQAFNNSDTEKAKECLAQILKLDGQRILKYRSIISVAMFENKLDELSLEFKEKVLAEFTDHSNWVENVDSLKLFANCLQVFTTEQLDVFMRQLLKHYSKSKIESEKMVERVAIICNNYLYYCYFFHVAGNNINSALEYLNKLDNRNHFLMYKICYKFYDALFKGRKEQAKEIKNFLVFCGFKDRVAGWKI